MASEHKEGEMSKFSKDLKEAQKKELECVEILTRYKRFRGFKHTTQGMAMGDMYNPQTNEWVEIKADSYDSGNFFIERYSKLEEKSPGGPWQSKAKFYVSYHYNQGKIYIFRKKELIEGLESLIKEKGIDSSLMRENTVPPKRTGGNYHTFGYVINQDFLCSRVFNIVLNLKETK